MSLNNFYQVNNIGGKWWLVNPDGKNFISKGVCNLNFAGDKVWQSNEAPYNQNVLKKYRSKEKWLDETAKRLQSWGINTLGAWCYEPDLRKQFPYTEILNIAQEATGGYAWAVGNFPDVFSANFRRVAGRICQNMCQPLKDDTHLIGYFTDNELRFLPDYRSSETLLDAYLKFPETQEGNKVARDFVNKYGKDDMKFLELIAQVYFQTCYETIKKYDPNHLILGCRFSEVPEESGLERIPEELLRPMKNFVDVLSYNHYFLITKAEDEKYLQETLNYYADFTNKPILISEFSFLGADSGYPTVWSEDETVIPKPGILEVQLGNQIERAKAAETYIAALMKNPNVVGYHWFQYTDYPFEGRQNDGVAANFGLVKVTDEPWQSLVNTIAEVNHGAEEVHESVN